MRLTHRWLLQLARRGLADRRVFDGGCVCNVTVCNILMSPCSIYTIYDNLSIL